MFEQVKDKPKRQHGSEIHGNRNQQKISSGSTQQIESSSRLLRIIGNQALLGRSEVDPNPTRTIPDTQNIEKLSDSGHSAALEDRTAPIADGDIVPLENSASMAITGNGAYVDTATESRKNVKFTATWTGGAKEDYIIVNWVKGYAKKADGTYFKAMLYGSAADINFSDWKVDSVDEDPAYWSNGGTRWRYTVDAANKFSATDSPIQMKMSAGEGTVARLDFKTAVYKSSDVPSTTTGTLAATPLSTFEAWSYYTKIVPQNYVELNPALKFDHT